MKPESPHALPVPSGIRFLWASIFYVVLCAGFLIWELNLWLFLKVMPGALDSIWFGVIALIILPVVLELLGIVLFWLIHRADSYLRSVVPGRRLSVIPRVLIVAGWVCLIWPHYMMIEIANIYDLI